MVLFASGHHTSVKQDCANCETANFMGIFIVTNGEIPPSPSEAKAHGSPCFPHFLHLTQHPFLPGDSSASSSLAIPLLLPLRRYVQLLLNLPSQVAGVRSSADDSLPGLPTRCATEAVVHEGGEEWELWPRVRQMREQTGGEG